MIVWTALFEHNSGGLGDSFSIDIDQTLTAQLADATNMAPHFLGLTHKVISANGRFTFINRQK